MTSAPNFFLWIELVHRYFENLRLNANRTEIHLNYLLNNCIYFLETVRFGVEAFKNPRNCKGDIYISTWFPHWETEAQILVFGTSLN